MYTYCVCTCVHLSKHVRTTSTLCCSVHSRPLPPMCAHSLAVHLSLHTWSWSWSRPPKGRDSTQHEHDMRTLCMHLSNGTLYTSVVWYTKGSLGTCPEPVVKAAVSCYCVVNQTAGWWLLHRSPQEKLFQYARTYIHTLCTYVRMHVATTVRMCHALYTEAWNAGYVCSLVIEGHQQIMCIHSHCLQQWFHGTLFSQLIVPHTHAYICTYMYVHIGAPAGWVHTLTCKRVISAGVAMNVCTYVRT